VSSTPHRFPPAPVAPRQLGDALAAPSGAASAAGRATSPVVGPATVTPWLATVAAAPGPTAADRAALATARAEAVAAGRTEGLSETERLRGRLAAAIDAAAAARAASTTETTALVAEVATMVVETWLGAAAAADRLRPIVTGWLAGAVTPATAAVHPSELDGMLCAVDDAAITVVADPALAPGDVVITGGAFELRVDWRERLAELRDLVAAALEQRA
jgi:flagellar biosynthesis/type III secretory pathway protein FliH